MSVGYLRAVLTYLIRRVLKMNKLKLEMIALFSLLMAFSNQVISGFAISESFSISGIEDLTFIILAFFAVLIFLVIVVGVIGVVILVIPAGKRMLGDLKV